MVASGLSPVPGVDNFQLRAVLKLAGGQGQGVENLVVLNRCNRIS